MKPETVDVLDEVGALAHQFDHAARDKQVPVVLLATIIMLRIGVTIHFKRDPAAKREAFVLIKMLCEMLGLELEMLDQDPPSETH